MSLSTTFTLDTAANFTYDSAKMAVTTAAALILANTAIDDFSEDFADDTGFTYDNTKAEFTGGLVRQLDQRPAGAVLGARFDSTIDANWANESPTATLVNTPVINGGKLDLTSGAGVIFDLAAISMVGCIRMKITFNYNGIPVQPQIFFAMDTLNNPGGNGILQLAHISNGSFFLLGSDSDGNNIFSNSLLSFDAVSGTEAEIEFSWDLLTEKKVRIFGSGYLLATIDADYARASTCLRIGSADSNFLVSDLIVFDSVQHTANYTPGYSVVPALFVESKVDLPTYSYSGLGNLTLGGTLTSTEVGAPRYIIRGKYWTGSAWATSDGTYAQASPKATIATNFGTFPTTGSNSLAVSVVFGDLNSLSSVSQVDLPLIGQIYPIDNPAIASNSSVLCDGLSSVAVVSTQTGGNLIKYIVSVQNLSTSLTQDYYYNGSAWAVSDGSYAQSNTLAQINTNIATLNSGVLSAGKRVLIKAFLHSADGSSTPTLTSITLVYNFFTALDADPATTIVFGYLYDSLNQPIVGAVVTLDNRIAFEYGSRVIAKGKVTTTTDSRGYWEFQCVENTSVVKVYFFDFAWTVANVDYTLITKAGVTIPSQTSVDFNTLTWEFSRT